MLPNDDQRSLQEAARRVALGRRLPTYMQREKDAGQDKPTDRALLHEMGTLGLLGVDSVTTGLIVEELAYGDLNISAIVLVISLCGAIIAKNAQPAVAAVGLPRIRRGDAILALSITEPGVGSDAGALKLQATRDRDAYVLNGKKASTTYCDYAMPARRIRSRPQWSNGWRRVPPSMSSTSAC